MRYTHLIWDFDGTLFDTYPRMAGIFVAALARYGVQATKAEVLPIIKKTVRDAASRYAPQCGAEAEDILRAYREVEAGMTVEGMRPYPNAAAVVRSVMEAGGRNYLYTHRNQTALEALEVCGMRDCFVDAITIDHPFPHKPAPDAILYLLKKHNIAPQTALMLGDRALDVEAGKNAGIAGMLFDPEHFYDDYACPLRADSMRELADALEIPL